MHLSFDIAHADGLKNHAKAYLYHLADLLQGFSSACPVLSTSASFLMFMQRFLQQWLRAMGYFEVMALVL